MSQRSLNSDMLSSDDGGPSGTMTRVPSNTDIKDHQHDNSTVIHKVHTKQEYEDEEIAELGDTNQQQVTKVATEKDADDPFLVTFDMDDPQRPLNWPFKKKAYHTALFGITTFAAQFGSAVMTPIIPHLSLAFDVNEKVATLPTTVYVLGIAFGPMFFAPLSETYGRKIAIYMPFFISTLLSVGTASCENIAGIICSRFFAGFFAGAPVVSAGGVLADIWEPGVRGISLVFYAFFVSSGPVFGPILSSVVTNYSPYAWKWSLWMHVMISFVVLAVGVTTLHETYAPVLLTRKAKKLRTATKNWAFHSKHEEWSLTLNEFFSIHFVRPFAMLGTPIVFFIALFASYVFGIFYMALTGFTYAFEEVYGMGYITSNLPLISLFLGNIGGGVINISFGRRYARLIKANNGAPLPEQRFPPMMFFGWFFPAGLFIFAWTSYARIHWIVPCIGLFITQTAFFVIFQGCLNYLVDTFSRFSASAIAANSFCRSIFAATFPLFSRMMFRNLGVHWAGTIVAMIAVPMLPIPFVFFYFGKSIRARNPYARLVT